VQAMAGVVPSCHRRRERAGVASFLVLGLVIGAVSSGALSFARLAPLPLAGRRGRAALQGPRVSLAGVGADGKYSYEAFPWLVDLSATEEQVKAVVSAMPDDAGFWPDASKYLDRESFRQFVKGRSSGVTDVAFDTVFNSFNGGSGYLDPSKRDGLMSSLKRWRAGDIGGLQAGIFGARLSVLGAFLFLNVFSVYAGYFIIGRPILYQLFGIDLLPNLVRFWEVQ